MELDFGFFDDLVVEILIFGFLFLAGFGGWRGWGCLAGCGWVKTVSEETEWREWFFVKFDKTKG